MRTRCHSERSGYKLNTSLKGAILALDIEISRSCGNVSKAVKNFQQDRPYILGPVIETCPRDESAGRIDVSRNCLLMFAVALKALGVEVGARG